MVKQLLGFKAFPTTFPLAGDAFLPCLIRPVFTTNTAPLPPIVPPQLRVLLLHPRLQRVQQEHVADLVGRLVQQEVALQDAVQLCHLEFHVLQLALRVLMLDSSLLLFDQLAFLCPELCLLVHHLAQLVVDVVVHSGELVVDGGQGKPVEADPQPGAVGRHSGSPCPGRRRHLLAAPWHAAPPAP